MKNNNVNIMDRSAGGRARWMVDRRRPRGRQTSSSIASLEAVLRNLGGRGGRFGLGVVVGLAERQGDRTELNYAQMSRFFSKPGRRPKAAMLSVAEAGDVAKLFDGLAHVDRIRVARAVMTGANTHRLLSEAVGLKTGPLYHHLRTLERAGILMTLGRNTYTLSDSGRVALLVANLVGLSNGRGARVWKTKRFRS